MAHTENLAHPISSEEAGHELSDTSFSVPVIFGVGVVILIVTSIIVVIGLLGYFETTAAEQRNAAPASSVVDTQQLPAGPLLQANPERDWNQMQETKEEILHSYGWVDKRNERVRIPIDQAMDLLLERGLPVREE